MLRGNSQTDQLLPQETLQYEPAPPRAHRMLRRATWWLFCAAIATLSIAIAWRRSTQIQYLWFQHQLMGYNVPDGPMRVDGKGSVQNAPTWPASKVLEPMPHYPVYIHQ